MKWIFVIAGATAGGFLGRLLDRKAERDREAAGIQPQEECATTS